MIQNNIRVISSLLCRYAQLFSEVQTKGFRMPVKEVQRKLKPKRPVQFIEGRALLYLNKQGLFTPTLLTTHLTVPMIYIAYLIKNNPFYLTFPAALPLLGLLQFILFIRFVTHKKDNKYQIERIYLSENGDLIEVWFANKIRRALKNTMSEMFFQVKDLKPPPQGQHQLPRKGTQFPEHLTQIKYPAPWQYGWYKYDSNRENYIIPKRFEYANLQILIPAMSGIEIDTSQCPKTPVPIDEHRKMPTLEDALKEVEQKKKFEEEWQKSNGVLQYTKSEDI